MIESHFVRKNYVSYRFVGSAPAAAFKKEIEKKARGKKARGEDVRMRRCEDKKIAKMRRCEDEKMRR